MVITWGLELSWWIYLLLDVEVRDRRVAREEESSTL
jgi:hypothetical protein